MKSRCEESGFVSGYVDGVQQWSVSDSGYGVSPGNILNFFVDDWDTWQGEGTSGSVDFIRIYDNALTENEVANLSTDVLPPQNVPDAGSTLAFLGLGLAGLVGLRRRFAV